MTLESNFPKKINGTFIRMSSDNAKETERQLANIKQIISNHANSETPIHKADQIAYESTTVDKELKVLRNQVLAQVVGKSNNSAAELKDIRVDTQGTLHSLAQDRLNADFGLIGDIANMAKALANKHEKELNKNIYYNEVSTRKGRKFDTTYYITHIPHKDKDGNLIKLKKGIEGLDPNKPEHITAREFAIRHNATFVTNASTGSASQLKLHGQQIYNGQIIDSDKEYKELKDRWTLAIGDDNSLKSFPQNIDAASILAQGYNNTVSGFGPIISDGKIIAKDSDYSPNTIVKHPRSVIAQLKNKDLIFFSCDGRENNNKGFIEKGMTLQEVGETLLSEYGNIEFAYNMDGGGSTSNILRSRKLNKAQDEDFTADRPVLDFLYIAKEKPEKIIDEDLKNAFDDIGEVRALVQKVYGELYKFNRTSSKEFGLTGYDQYTGFLSFDEEGNPRKKLYQSPEGWRFWDYDLGRTMFRITDDRVEHNNRTFARNFSNPETVTDVNSLSFGGTYHVPSNAKGSPYPNLSSAIVTHYNVSAREFDDAAIAFQTAVPFIRSSNYTMRRRTYAQGAWSQWFDV